MRSACVEAQGVGMMFERIFGSRKKDKLVRLKVTLGSMRRIREKLGI